MTPRHVFALSIALALFGLFSVLAPSFTTSLPSPLELRDGDRVVFVGNTSIERLNKTNFLETLLTCRHPDRNLTFRNLGWSGDNVWGHSRAGFDPPASGFGKLKKQIEEASPSVLLVGYGMNESFRGAAGLDSFRDGAEKLLGMLESTLARIVLISPIAHENCGPPLPDGQSHNDQLTLYVNALEELATTRGHSFVNLFEDLRKNHGAPLTDNGIHLNEYGAWVAARAVADALILAPPTKSTADAITVLNINTKGKAKARLIKDTAIQSGLPPPLPPRSAPLAIRRSTGRLVRARDLQPGRWELRVDGSKILERSAAAWASGVTVTSGPEFEQLSTVRLKIARKNELFFHRWRPYNTTYLLGFRRHEQGKNAAEIANLDPLISELEAQIAALRRPSQHTYELVFVGNGGSK